MAKNPNYTRTNVAKFSIKGLLSEDGETITYINDDKDEDEISVAKCFEGFRGEPVEISISNKMIMDLGDDSGEV